MVDFGAAIKRPFSDFGKLGIGVSMDLLPTIIAVGLAFLFGILGVVVGGMSGLAAGVIFAVLISVGLSIIIGFILYGYGLECARSAMDNNFSLPEWKDFGRLFVKGLVGSIIVLIYLLPAIVLFAVLFVLFALPSMMGGFSQFQQGMPDFGMVSGTANIPPPPSLPEASPMDSFSNGSDFSSLAWIWPLIIKLAIIILIVSPLFIFLSYLSVMAVMNYVKKDNIGSAFNLGEVFRKAFRGKYFGAWIVALLYSIALIIPSALIKAFLSYIPFLGDVMGIIIQAVVTVIVLITTMTIYGQAYND